MCCHTADSSAFTPVCHTSCGLDGISDEEMTDSLLGAKIVAKKWVFVRLAPL